MSLQCIARLCPTLRMQEFTANPRTNSQLGRVGR